NPGHDTTPASSNGERAGWRELYRAPGGGKKMFLTSPFIDQAITRFNPLAENDGNSEPGQRPQTGGEKAIEGSQPTCAPRSA
ncbi:MAG: hypothetical protein WBE44_13605, partial [Terriglobales bacterium]